MNNLPIKIEIYTDETDLIMTIIEQSINKQNKGCELRFKAHEITNLEDFLEKLSFSSINMKKKLEQIV